LLLCLPCLIALAVFVYWPTVRTAYLSVHGSDLVGRPTRFVGGANFAALATDPTLRQVVVTTLVVAGASTALATGLALIAALLLGTVAPRGGRIVTVLLSLPFAYSTAAASATFAALFTPVIGLVTRGFMAVTGSAGPNWLTSPFLAVVAIVIATAWYEFGFAFLVLIAAMSLLDRSVLEAAALDGAGELRTALGIVVPSLRPSLLFLVVTQTVTGLQIFTQVQVITRGGPGDATHTIVYELYNRAFGGGFPQYGVASALALVLLVAVVAVTGAQFRLTRERA
jgi:sn-glycerol 3-phosphate transport system permease protein